MTMSPRSRIHSRHWSTTISNGSTSHMDMGSRDEFGVGLRVSSTLKPTLVVTYLHTDITYVCISIIYYPIIFPH